MRAQSETDPTKLLAPALEKMSESKRPATRFTYLDLHHTQNFNEKGKSTADITQLFEVTYIADLEYSKLLETNGKPLSGRDLEREQKRYDDAVRNRAALDEKSRARLQHQLVKSAGVNLTDFLAEYQSTMLGQVNFEGRGCVLLSAIPVSSSRHKRFQIWIDPAAREMLRLDFTQLTDEGDTLSGGTGTQSWIFIDGIPLLSASHVDVMTLNENKRVRVVVDHTYSRFRKFSVTTRIIPGELDENK